MGALHAGHASLVGAALRTCDQVVVSIFVNPLQFNDPEDLARYPRQPRTDHELLEQVGCHALFMPSEKALFQGLGKRTFDLGGLDTHWEGPDRPGHFQGVVNVVERLFLYTRPDVAYFGEKDRQQLAIIRHVAKELHWPERIVGCPTLREPDGLAMSSRNMRLDPDERRSATLLHQALLAVETAARTSPPASAREAGLTVLAGDPLVHVDHLGIADALTLEPLVQWPAHGSAVVLLAARVGAVRLIDNLSLRL